MYLNLLKHTQLGSVKDVDWRPFGRSAMEDRDGS